MPEMPPRTKISTKITILFISWLHSLAAFVIELILWIVEVQQRESRPLSSIKLERPNPDRRKVENDITNHQQCDDVPFIYLTDLDHVDEIFPLHPPPTEIKRGPAHAEHIYSET
jgi:hypothetical protein